MYSNTINIKSYGKRQKKEERVYRMLKSIKNLRSLGKVIFFIGWGTWLLETLIYILMYGWHTTPITAVEKGLDYATGMIMMVGIGIMLKSMWDTNKMLLEILEEKLK